MLLKKNKKLALILSGVFILLLLNGCALESINTKVATDDNAQSNLAATESQNPEITPPEVVIPEKTYTPSEICLRPYNLWDRIRDSFELDHTVNNRIKQEIEWYSRHQGYIDRVVDRARPYLYHMTKEAEARGIPTEIVLLPIVESAFQPFAYSHGRAAGLWQFIPATGRRYKLKMSWWYDGRRDVYESTRAAYDYLTYLNKLFDGDWMHALAAYNSGEGTVMKAIRKNKKRGRKTDYWSLDLPSETEGYVPKLLAISRIIDEPYNYNIDLGSIENEPVLASVDIGSQIDMDLAAELAEITLDDIYRYNPAFNRWATDPNGPHQLLVPIEKAQVFKDNLAQYPKSERIAWKRHKVKSGEVLGTIAEDHHTTVSLIKKVNNIRGNDIRIGQRLIIPVSRKKLHRYTMSSTQRLKKIKNTPRSGTRIDHIVAAGDTLWDISRHYRVSVGQLANWNGMAPRDTLRPGSKLVIWKKVDDEIQELTTSINPANFKHPYEKNTNRRIGYTVRPGDSLALISQKFGVTISKLKRWNSSLNGRKYLQPGDRIVLYVDVKRQSGQI